jgi:hypothetical protein
VSAPDIHTSGNKTTSHPKLSQTFDCFPH